MTIHLLRDFKELSKELSSLGALVETTINKSIVSITSRRPELAEEVIQEAYLINEMEIGIEEECLKILALHQPVAKDLRYVVAILKVNNDLERMGDLAENIAERSIFLAKHRPVNLPLDKIGNMADQVRNMVRMSLDALIEKDTVTAEKIIAMDDVVDQFNRDMYEFIQDSIKDDVGSVESCIQWLSTSRYLERIADLTTNIAEDVIFMVEGRVVRHMERENI